MKQLKVGIIGCGIIFPMHAESIKRDKFGVLKAVCDIEPGIAKKAGNKYRVPYYTDYKTMAKMEELDVVHVCTPHYLHKEMSVYCLDAGINVLQEKPMAMSVKEALEITRKAKAVKVKYGVIFQNRYTPAAILSRKTINSGRLGKICSAKLILTWHKPDKYYLKSRWRGTFDKEGGGVIIDQAIHSLDLLRWLFNSEVEYVDASTFNRLHDIVEVEDEAIGVIMFKSGAYISFYTMNHYSYDDDVFMEIHGKNGRIKIIKDSADVYYKTGKAERAAPKSGDYIDYGNGVKDYWGICHSIQINKFYGAILKNKPFEINADEGLKTQWLVNAIYESSRLKKRLYMDEFKENLRR